MDSSKIGNRAAWLQGPTGHCEERPPEMVGPWRLVLLGAPGVGKGTQADLLHQRLGACHLSTGDVFRAAGSQAECDQSPAIRDALAHMRRGELVPDSTVWELVRERKGCLHCGGGFILDGFPRTLAQAESLQKLLKYEEISLTAVVNYELSTEEIVARLSGRRTCAKCKAVYHIASLPPKVDGQCDRCGGKLFQREDDRPESVKVRLDAYERSTKPLLDFYEKSELLRKVPATGSPEEIYQRTIPAINTRHVSQCAEQLWSAAENRR
jgi:adenylate kinase